MESSKLIDVEEIGIRIVIEPATVLPTDGILGGTVLTGFIDVEKLIHIKKCGKPVKTLFLEKKLPFSIVILSIDTSEK